MYRAHPTWLGPTMALSLLFALASLLVAPCQAEVVVDDFELTAFALAAPSSPGPLLMAGVTPPHGICGVRYAALEVGVLGGAATATLTPDVYLDDAVQVNFTGLGPGRFGVWHFAQVDGYDLRPNLETHLNVRLSSASPSGQIQVTIRDMAENEVSQSLQIGGPATYSFPLANFASVDLHDVELVLVTIGGLQGTHYSLADIRTGTNDAGWFGVRSIYEEIQTPPYPPPFLSMHLIDPLTLVPQYRFDTEIVSAENAEEMPLFVRLNEQPESAHIGFEWAGPFDYPLSHGTMNFRFHLTGLVGSSIQLTLGEPILLSTKAFTVPYAASLYDDAGSPRGTSEGWIHVIPGPRQPFDFDGVRVALVASKTATATIDLQFEMLGSAELTEPLLEVLLESHPTTQSVTGVEGIVPSQSLQFAAYPSVVQSTTQLRLSRSASSDASVQLYDLAGRRVRRLTIAAGQSIATWDGRDDGGAPVASGVYVARFDDGLQQLTAKVVRLGR